MRPRLRLPLWAAAAIPVAAYLARSAIRGDASPDLPGDAVVIAVVVAALLLGWRYGSAAANRGGDELSHQVDERHGPAGDGGQDHEVR